MGTNLWDGKVLSAYMKQEWGIKLGIRQCQRLFRQLGFRLRKPRSKIASADPEKQEGFKKLKALSKNDTIDLWFIDEVHFQQYGSACRMWVPPEIANPVLLHQPTRKSIGYFGAVRVKDGKFVYQREENKFNGESFSPFLNDCAVVVAVQAEKLWLSLITQDIIMQLCTRSGENKIDGNLHWNFYLLTVQS